jgi:hypothetical protein
MNWGDIPTAIGVVVALTAAAVASWQAAEAKKSRKAAEQQAAEATNSRIAAQQQAREATRAREIAEETLAISQRIETDRQADRKADQNAKDAPEFAFDPSFYMGDDEIIVDVRMKRGPDLEYVEFTAVGPNVRGVSSPEGTVSGSPSLRWDHVSTQDMKQVRLDASDPNLPIHATLRLRSVERRGHRQWEAEYHVDDPI